MLTATYQYADTLCRGKLLRYPLTVLLLLATASVRWALDPVLGHDLPFGPFVVPLVVCAYLLGSGPALLCTLAGAFFGLIFGRAEPNPVTLVSGTVLYLVTGVVVTAATLFLEQAQRKLDRARRQVLDAHQHKDRFLAILGHELRNPLNGIVLGAQLLARQVQLDPKALNVAQMVDRQARHMQRLLDEMREVSRLELGKVQLVWSDVVLQEVISFCLEQQTRALEDRGQSLHLQMPSEPVTVHADRDRIIQVIANLLTNASKYSGAQSQIDIHLWSTRGAAILEVRDTGPGIPDDKLPAIFEPFMQVDTTLNRADGGMGLGLPTVRKLVELHGGSVQVSNSRNEDGRGAVFTVRLPLNKRQTAEAETHLPLNRVRTL